MFKLIRGSKSPAPTTVMRSAVIACDSTSQSAKAYALFSLNFILPSDEPVLSACPVMMISSLGRRFSKVTSLRRCGRASGEMVVSA